MEKKLNAASKVKPNWAKLFSAKIDEWGKEMKKLIPKDFKLTILPMKFLYIESEKIKSMIIENAIDFFSVKEEKMIFAVAGKIFNYPNKIYCVRIVLAYFSC